MRRFRTLLASGVLVLAGCTTPPPPPPPAPEPPAVPLPLPPMVAPACPACLDQSFEISRLRQDLAAREAELKDLRSSQREQVKAIQESTREVTRAKARVRRLATQADAASYLAEVEVALNALKASSPALPPAPLMPLAQALVDAAAAPFAQGDYATAMDRAAQAEQLIAVIADSRAQPPGRSRVPGEILLQAAIPLRLTVDSPLRREPLAKAPVVVPLRKDSPVVAHAYKGSWMRVETEDGRSGWVAQGELGAR